MKKAVTYTMTFGVGFVMCAFALKALYGFEPSGLLPGTPSESKQAVLASLNTPATPLSRTPGDSIVADAVAKLEPAVVDVHTIGKALPQSPNPFENDPIFRQWFGVPQRRGPLTDEEKPHGAGSGIIISSDGYILTNNHVVADTEKVEVTVGDGKKYAAKVIGTDPLTDIAVCKIDTHGVKLPVAELGDSDSIRIGDWAIAVGNPLDIGTTVTLGIISAKDRKGLSADGRQMQSVLQTDAAINPGNSGGALANINGQVVGINEAIYSPTGSYVGIGFAIPINSAKKIAAQLIDHGKITRPYLGVSYAALSLFTQDARKQIGLDLKGDEGVVVQEVYPGSPAHTAGLQQYDVILEANRQKIYDNHSLDDIIQTLKVGDDLVLLVYRDGHQQLVTVTLKERPADFGDRQQQQQQQPDDQSPDQPQQPDQQQPDQQVIPFGP